MKARQLVRATRVRGHLPPFEATLKELTFNELLHMSAVLHRDGSGPARQKMDMVRRELDSRRFVALQSALLAT